MTQMSLSQFHALTMARLRQDLQSAGPSAAFDIGKYASEAGLADQQYPILEIETLVREGFARDVGGNTLLVWLTAAGVRELELPKDTARAHQPGPAADEVAGAAVWDDRVLRLAEKRAATIEAEMIR